MLARAIAIDAGSANTLVVAKKQGILHHEPSVVAIDSQTRKVLAVGARASDMIGRESGHIAAVRPIRFGAVADLEGALTLFRFFLKKAAGNRFVKPNVLISTSSASTKVQRRALSDLAFAAGAGEVRLLDDAIAAALGAGLPVTDPVGSMVVNVGAGRSSVAVISLGAPVVAQVTDAAGHSMDEEIMRHMRQAHNLLIGPRTAERIKLHLGAAAAPITVAGRHVVTGLPTRITVEPAAIRAILAEIFARLEMTVRQVLERTPPELLSDIALNGMVLTGGGALTSGLAEQLQSATGLPVHTAPDPDRAAANGALQVLEHKVRDGLAVPVAR